MSEKESSIKSDLERLDALADSDIDYSDIPELSEEFLESAKQVMWPPDKERITIRVDRDVLEWLKSQGKGYQTRINQLLRLMMEHSKTYEKEKKSR